MATFDNILEKYRQEANSKRNLGDRFEVLMKGFLKTYPLYINEFSKIWLWKDFPYKTEFGAGQDIGIDLVAKISDNEYCAIQCKFFSENTTIDKSDVDSFITTSARSFRDETGRELRFASRLWISTTNKWSSTAEDSLKGQDPKITTLSLNDLENAEVDWDLIEKGIYGEKARLKKKLPRKHQELAIENSHKHFTLDGKDRGKLIMACGTGKTFTSLKIAEKETESKSTLIIDNFNIYDDLDTIFEKSNLHDTIGGGLVLFLVPSIALVGQTLKEWSEQASNPINAICICSDAEVSKVKDEDGFDIEDLALPASTNVPTIVRNFERIIKKKEKKLKESLQEELDKIRNSKKGKNAGAKADINKSAEENITGKINYKLQNEMTIVFSTYHSIETISKAQAELNKKYKDKDGNGNFIFDLIVCDEAHRTSGVILKEEKESFFTKVHNNDFLQAKRRLYMTATPRLYKDEVKTKAKENEKIDILCSMDDENIYGEEIYRIGFGEAVQKGLLADYKVIVLTIKEDEITQKMISKVKKRNEEIKNIQDKITEDDLAKIIGCINAISKNTFYGENLKEIDPNPIKKAVAFTHSIKNSLHITSIFNEITNIYYEFLDEKSKAELSTLEGQHIDGHMGSALREERLKWLKTETNKNQHCRILTNVKCLSEGVDVPSLDAILFLSAKNSEIDVVQSVGRVMRIAPNKKYGYIIIPVVIPYGENPEDYLDKSDKFKAVWSILNALRAHDDRFNAYVNTLEIDKRGKTNVDTNIIIDQIKTASQDKDGKINVLLDEKPKLDKVIAEQLAFNFKTYQNKVYATLVKKVGNKKYIEQWASDVGEIAKKNINRINDLIKTNTIEKEHFDEFMDGLHKNINPSISNEDAIEMLSQHLITKPIFEVLFKDYSFARNNPMSQSMEKMIQLIEEKTPEEDSEKLKKFYDSVQLRIEGIKTAEGRQTIIYELYDKFFKKAFPKVVEKLGIVYTPVEVVDFIIHSVADVLKHEFDRDISDENVNILDPFTGTGTFITRLLQSNLIKPEDLKRKYEKEIFANEIVLLAYYIASINIENIYHSIEDEIKTKQQSKLLESEKNQRVYAEDSNERFKKQDLDIVKAKNILYLCLKKHPITNEKEYLKINAPMGSFTIDILETTTRFAIEIKNPSTSDIELDKTRREKVKYLKSIDFNVLELTSDEVLEDIEGSLRKVFLSINHSNYSTLEGESKDCLQAFGGGSKLRSSHSTLEGESIKSSFSEDFIGGGNNKIYNNQKKYTPITLERAQELRKNTTNPEKFLWYFLKEKQMAGFKFRRQQPIDKYIVDFICFEKKLIIELDGGQHNFKNNIKYDKTRDDFLKNAGYEVLRTWDNELFNNINGVLETIYNMLTLPPPNEQVRLTPPQGGSDSTHLNNSTLDREGLLSSHSPLEGESNECNSFGGGSDFYCVNQEEIIQQKLEELNTQFEEYFSKIDLKEFKADYTSFNGICLTDTFQLYEDVEQEKTIKSNINLLNQVEKIEDFLKENTERIKNQKKSPITIIIGNPPYSVGQKSQNDNAQNQKYLKLDKKVSDTYAKYSVATNKNSLHDSYIKAFRWATDRINETDDGVIGFITNSGWLDSNSFDGFRKCLEEDFSKIYIIDLKGGIRGKSGELAKKEGQNVFDIMTGVAIVILIKEKNKKLDQKAEIKYLNIGNYLSRKEKLGNLIQYKNIYNSDIEWEIITPNKENDWLNLRNDIFSTFIPIEAEKKFNSKTQSYFIMNSCGLKTNRDSWCYNFSKNKLENNINITIDYYNQERERYNKEKNNRQLKDFVIYDKTKINWTSELLDDIKVNKEHSFNKNSLCNSIYRPFIKQNIYFNRNLNERVYQMEKIFPTQNHKNLIISMAGIGNNNNFSVIITNNIVDLGIVSPTQCFPLYYYEKIEPKTAGLFDNIEQGTYRKHDAVSDFILNRVQETHGDTFNKEDIFYYVYGLLHSPIYREKFAVDLKKMLPRIPIVKKFKDFKAFIKAGRDLAELHLNYEEVPACPDVKVTMNPPFPLEGKGSGVRGQNLNLNYSSRNYTETTLNQAKELRQKDNLAEKLLWEKLRNKNLENIKFKREQPIDKYIVDFVCFEKNLIIELDGGIHNLTDVAIKDIERQEYLESLGFNFLRFNSQEVVNNIEEVLKKIKATYERLTPSSRLDTASGDNSTLTPNPRPLPLKGEGEDSTHTLKGRGEFSTHTIKGEWESEEELFNYYRVEKIKFKDKKDKSCIIYNSNITLENIPLKAYDYVVNGKSAIEWILDRYDVSTNKDTQITNDANDWAVEVDKPSYILDLLLSVIELSVKSAEIVDGLPKVEFE